MMMMRLSVTMKCSKYSSIGPTIAVRRCRRLPIGLAVVVLFLLTGLTGCGVGAWTCSIQERDIPSKTLESPLVFEATVLATSHTPSGRSSAKLGSRDGGDSRPSVYSSATSRQAATLHTVMYHIDLRVDKVYKDGRTAAAANSNNNYGARSAVGLLEKSKVNLHYWSWSKPDVRNVNGECAFRGDLFVVGQKYIVFAEAESDSLSMTSSQGGEDVPVVSDSFRFTLFSEPVVRNKTSSRQVRKILCRKCAVPASVKGLKNTTVNVRGRIRLRCGASGNPAPEITWLRNGQELKSSYNVKVKSKRKQSILEIANATLNDAGIYECKAANVIGSPASIKAKVTVRRKKIEVTTSTTMRSYTIGNHNGSPCPVSFYCLNGGTCTFFSVLGEPVCKCAEGYKGQRCDSKDVHALGKSYLRRTYHKNIFTVVVILGVLLCTTILGSAAYFILRRKRRLRGKTKTQLCRLSRSKNGAANGDSIEMQLLDVCENNMNKQSEWNGTTTNREHLEIAATLEHPVWTITIFLPRKPVATNDSDQR